MSHLWDRRSRSRGVPRPAACESQTRDISPDCQTLIGYSFSFLEANGALDCQVWRNEANLFLIFQRSTGTERRRAGLVRQAGGVGLGATKPPQHCSKWRAQASATSQILAAIIVYIRKNSAPADRRTEASDEAQDQEGFGDSADRRARRDRRPVVLDLERGRIVDLSASSARRANDQFNIGCWRANSAGGTRFGRLADGLAGFGRRYAVPFDPGVRARWGRVAAASIEAGRTIGSAGQIFAEPGRRLNVGLCIVDRLAVLAA